MSRTSAGKPRIEALCLLVLSIAFALVAVMESGSAPALRSFAQRLGRQESWFQGPMFGPGSHSNEWDSFMSGEE